jgi:hypothetical protein
VPTIDGILGVPFGGIATALNSARRGATDVGRSDEVAQIDLAEQTRAGVERMRGSASEGLAFDRLGGGAVLAIVKRGEQPAGEVAVLEVPRRRRPPHR